MRKLSQLSIPKEVSAEHPNGAILNETDTVDGTYVVRELYTDILSNLYKVLDVTGVVANGDEDGTTAGHQLLEAFQKLPNIYNDIEQPLSLSSGQWFIPIDITFLPEKYFVIAKAADNYTPGLFRGTDTGLTYSFTSSGFDSGDEVLLIISSAGTVAYKLSQSGVPVTEEVFTVMGTPLPYNDSDTLYYREQGNLLKETPTPSVSALEQIIRVDEGDASLIVTDMFVAQDYILCCVYAPGDVTYKFFQFTLSSPTASVFVDVVGATIGVGTDFEPYFFCDGNNLYITNNANNSPNDYELTALQYTPGTEELTFASNVSLDVTFVKSTNSAIKANKLYTFVSGVLANFDVTTGAKVSLGTFNGTNGNLFTYLGQIYFTAGEVAKKWF